jgi:hypothetical protein
MSDGILLLPHEESNRQIGGCVREPAVSAEDLVETAGPESEACALIGGAPATSVSVRAPILDGLVATTRSCVALCVRRNPSTSDGLPNPTVCLG